MGKEKRENIKLIVFGSIALATGAAIGRAVLEGTSPRTLNFIIGGAIAGLLCGLIPYFIGKKKNKKLSQIAIWSCVASGIILGALLALPVAIIFSIVIGLKNKKVKVEGEE